MGEEFEFQAKVAVNTPEVVSFCMPEQPHETWRIE